MAERRMFSKKVIESDAFSDLPLSAQALYFHLCMNADDDGFINNPKQIQRMIGAAVEDLKILMDSEYFIVFDSGVIVAAHWKMHNCIQKDRYKPSIYTEEKSHLQTEENNMYTLCIQPVSILDTQVRLGKDREDKYNIDKNNIGEGSEDEYRIDDYCEEDEMEWRRMQEEYGYEVKEAHDEIDDYIPPTQNNNINYFYGRYNNVILSDIEFDALRDEFPDDYMDRIERLSEYMASKGAKYSNHLATIRSWAAQDAREGKNPYADVNKANITNEEAADEYFTRAIANIRASAG